MIAPYPRQMETLLDAIPDGPLAAFALADYLEEQGDARGRLQGEMLRLVYSLTRSVGVDGRAREEELVRVLLGQGVRAIGPYRRVQLGQQVAMEFAWVPPGAFLMGSPEGEEGREPDDEETQDEGPQHEVTLTCGFWMGTVPVTQEQYERVVGRNPSGRQGYFVGGIDVRRTAPVEEVAWRKAVAFLKKMTGLVGGSGTAHRFRLPTEAEWEYACRAGTTTRFWSGDAEADLSRVGWYHENSRSTKAFPLGDCTTHPVGEKAANALGLSDMHGNVWEWCADLYDEKYYSRSPKMNPRCKRADQPGKGAPRVKRGGYAWGEAEQCRSAERSSYSADCNHNDIGFRVVADRL